MGAARNVGHHLSKLVLDGKVCSCIHPSFLPSIHPFIDTSGRTCGGRRNWGRALACPAVLCAVIEAILLCVVGGVMSHHFSHVSAARTEAAHPHTGHTTSHIHIHIHTDLFGDVLSSLVGMFLGFFVDDCQSNSTHTNLKCHSLRAEGAEGGRHPPEQESSCCILL
jgi:hypothetical protein